MPLSCIIYDLDGTLIDSAGDIAIAVNRVRRHFRLKALPEEDVREFIGDGAKKLIERAVFGIVDDPAQRPAQRLPRSGADIGETVKRFRQIYAEEPVIETTIVQGATEILERWQAEGVAQVCLTNKPYSITQRVLQRLDLLPFFDLVVGPGLLDDDGVLLPMKPDTAVLDYILEQTGAEKDETIMVGDGIPDMDLAKAGGIRCIPILNGYTDSDLMLGMAEDLDLAATSLLQAGEHLEALNESI